MSAGGATTRSPSEPPGRGRRQRRPLGAAQPLPRQLGVSGKAWLMLGVVAVINLIWIPAVGQGDAFARFETSILRQLAELRTGWLTDVMRAVNTGSQRGTTVLAWGLVLALVVFRRWRHLFAFLGSYVLLSLIGGEIIHYVARPRPYDVVIIGRWGGFSMPSPPVAVMGLLAIAITYSLVVPGRPRQVAKVVIVTVLAVFVFARLYLAVDHPSDAVYGIVLGISIPLIAFRWFTPNEAFPVTYRRGKKAHLDVSGERGRAIQQAVEEQLGLTILEVGHVGLAGSGGSTPLRLWVAGEPETYVFAKLYAKSHVMADRWYKIGRTILYGALEDEAPFHTVRRLVEYEDYTCRLLRDVGIPTATPYGIVEITAEREYLLVTEFLDGAVEIGDAEVDEQVIDAALSLIRQLWDAGLAHRDIKPANLMVRDGQVYLIDPFFVQVRPSSWRQAVDLANMMLVLAIRTDPELVYGRALKFFTADEIAQSFAATRGVASPTQVRTALKQDGRDLLARFRELAPKHPRIAIQRVNARRIALTLTVLGVGLLVVTQAVSLLSPVHELPINRSPECGTDNTVILLAQAVPSAAAVPCIDALPSGWKYGAATIRNGRGRFWLNSDQAGKRAVVVTFLGACDVSAAHEVESEEPDTSRFEQQLGTGLRLSLVRFDVFPGGCVRYDIDFNRGASQTALADVDRALAFVPRAALALHVREDQGLTLCGRGATCTG